MQSVYNAMYTNQEGYCECQICLRGVEHCQTDIIIVAKQTKEGRGSLVLH